MSFCICTLMALQSCQEEFETEGIDDMIAFKVTNDAEAVTRSGEEIVEIPLEVADEVLSLTLSTEDNGNGNFADGDVATRGAAFDNDAHKVSAIHATAIIENGNGGSIYINDENVSIANGKGRSTHFWPEKPLSFFAYTVSKDNVIMTAPVFQRTDGKCKGTFKYTLPAAAPPANAHCRYSRETNAPPPVLRTVTPAPPVRYTTFPYCSLSVIFLRLKLP